MPASTEGAPPIEVRGLSKTYRLGFFLNRQVRALQGLDLQVKAGQVYGLLGPNGAGKSTTIKILMNLVQPSSGEARLFGLPPARPDARRQVGFVPENPNPYEYLTGLEFVTLAGRLAGLSGQALSRQVNEVIAKVGMERAARLQIRRYSKGMTQRIAVAQALVTHPKLLILDEPTSGLDPVGRRQMRDLILAERARGTTVLFCTHIIPDVESLCDRVAVLVGGKLVREGSVEELLTAEVPLMEMTVEGLTVERLKALQPSAESIQVGERILLRAPRSDTEPLLRKVLDAGGHVTQLVPARFSLEDLFIRALQESKQPTVGGEML